MIKICKALGRDRVARYNKDSLPENCHGRFGIISQMESPIINISSTVESTIKDDVHEIVNV